MEKIHGAADPIHQEFPSVSPRPKPEDADTTVLEKTRRFQRPIVLGAIALSALSFGMGLKGDRYVAQPESDRPAATFTLQGGEQISFLQWKDMQAKATHQIIPDQEIQRLVSSRDPFFEELGLDPSKIENRQAFSEWVQNQLQTNKRVGQLGKLPAQMDGRELVTASALITADNLKYSWDADANAKTDRQPMDKILMEHLPAECETYTATQQAIFNELKSIYPEKLANTYLVENEIIKGTVMHYVNAVVEVESPQRASLAFIDPTGLDPDWHHNAHEVRQAEDAHALIAGVEARGITTQPA